MSRLSIWLLGPFKAELDGKRLSGFRSDKVRALLAYLSMESHRPWTRTSLAGLLWPDKAEGAALSNLRNALSNLRRMIGDGGENPPFLDITQETIQFNPVSDSWLDVKAFQDLIPKYDTLPPEQVDLGQLEKTLLLYRGDFMEGFSINSAPFEEWEFTTRERVRQQLLQTIRLATIAREQKGEISAALDCAKRWIELEPWDEDAYRHRIQILAIDGQRSAALAQCEELFSRLSRDLGVAPEPKTIQLYERIQNGLPVTLARAGFGTKESEKSDVIDSGHLPEFILEETTVEIEPKLFVSRQKELGQLGAWAEQAVSGEGGAYFVIGEPGSGKTALLAEFSRRALQQYPTLLVLWGQCNAYIGKGDAYFPFLSITKMLAGDIEPHSYGGVITLEHVQRLWEFLPETLTSLIDFGPDLLNRFLMAGNGLNLAQTHPGVKPKILESLNSQIKRQSQRDDQAHLSQISLFEQFSRVVIALSRSHPMLIILDDLQWIDSGSLNLLFHLGRQLTGSKILLLGSYRSEDVSLGRNGLPHPLDGVVQELQALKGDIVMDLAQSDGMDFVDALLDCEPNALGPEFRRRLFQRTSGHPLFTVELLRGMQLRDEIKKDKKGRWVEGGQLNWDQLPVRVEAVISRRIHHLTEECQSLLNVACVEGEKFTSEIIARVLEKDDKQVQALLSQEIGKHYHLVLAQGQSRIGNEKLSSYRFRHSLFQTYLYRHLDAVERVSLHGRIGNELERICCPEQMVLADFALTLAHHFTAGDMVGKAVKYYTLAGKKALRLSANQDALTHFYLALELLKSLPASIDRDRQELELQLSLGHPLTALKGWAPPEMAVAYGRAQELCQNISDNAHLIPALWLLATFRLGHSEHAECDRLVERLYRLAQQTDDPILIALASLQVSPFYQGKFVEAREKLELAGSFRDLDHQRLLAQQFGMAPAVTGLAYLAENLWFLGFPEQAHKTSLEARKLAEQIKHPLSSCYAFGRSNFLYAGTKDIDALLDQSARLFHVSQRYGFKPFEFASVFFDNWGNVMSGISSGRMIDKMWRMLDAYYATGTVLNRTAFLVLFAEACGKTGQFERGLDALKESIELAERTGELWYQAEAFRMKGELWAQHEANTEEAESCYLKAQQIASQQGARILELRADVSLFRLWDKQGKRRKQGRELLARIYNKFTEGFDTLDLRRAKLLLT